MSGYLLFLVISLAVASALPADPVVFKLDEERFQYFTDGQGVPQLVDLWGKASDLQESARYIPDVENVYHLFTRNNPTTSQVLAFGNPASVTNSNFLASRRTAFIIHGWTNHATSPINSVLVPAFLSAADMNVVVVDWHAGGGTINYLVAVLNTVTSGQGVARFITWLNSVSGASLAGYVIAGHSLGGHQAGIVGRNLGGRVPYIMSLDPALPGWITNANTFSSTDGIYTEVLHTNSGEAGYLSPLGDVDFYPNKGNRMPGCDGQNCDHNKAFHYFGESLHSGGFTGQRCGTFLDAVNGNCGLAGTLNMGGATPKTGQTGIFYLETNAAPPFSQR